MSLKKALEGLEREVARVEGDIARIESTLRQRRDELQSMREGIRGLSTLLKLHTQPSESQERLVEAEVETPTPDSPAPVASPPKPVPPMDDGAPRKRFRSTQFVGDLLAQDLRIWTFDEIVQAFHDSGAAAGMKNVPSAVRTALGRATAKGTVTAIDYDRFCADSYVPREEEL